MKKAFTLIELISTIIILSIIALISVPITTNIIDSSRNKAYEETINNIIEISKNYSVYNNLGYNTLYKELTFDELSNKGYIESSDIINPKNNQRLAGCVIYRWVIGSNQYEFKYDETCNGKASYPEVVINVTPDKDLWITEKLNFNIEGEYEGFKYCIEESECNPNIDYTSNVIVEKESKNLVICATGYNNKEIGKTTCTKSYKVDRTSPTLVYNITKSTNKIIVNANCTDDISGVLKKEYSINDNEYQDNNTFSNLSKGTYKISVKCTDNAGLTTAKTDNVMLENIKNPTIAQASQVPTNTSYAQQRIIKINYIAEGIENPEYYFKSSVVASVGSGVVVESCGTGNTPSTCTSSSVTSLVANTWYRTTSSTVNITYTRNGTLYAVTKDNTNISGTSTYSIANIDTSKPSITLDVGNIKTDRATLTLTCSDTESGITKYEYSKDNGESWVTGGNSYTFANLSQGTSYKYVGRCTNGSGLSNEANSTNTTNKITNPSIVQNSQTPSSGTWTQSRVIKITYSNENMNNAYYYFKSSVAASVGSGVVVESCGTGNTPSTCTSSSVTSLVANTWYRTTSSTVNITYTRNGTLYAVTKDNTNISGTSTYSIANIDTSKPSITMKVATKTDRATLTLTCSDIESGITKYEYSKDNGESWVTGTSNSYTFTGLTQGTSYQYVGRCTNGSGLSNTASSTNTTSTIPIPTITQISQEPSSGAYAIKRTLRITYGNTNVVSAKYYYSYDRKNWNEVTNTTVDIEFTNNGYLYAKTTDGTNTVTTTAYSVVNIETSNPPVPSITYNGGSNTCSWKNNYNLTLSSSASSGIAYYEIDVDNNGTADYTTGSNFIPSNGFNSDNVRFRAVTNAGRKSEWTEVQHIHMDTTSPSKPTIVLRRTSTSGSLYTSGSWTSNDIYHIASSSDSISGISYYQYSHDGVNWYNDINNWQGSYNSSRTEFTYVINWSGQWNFYVRTVDYAGNVSEASNMYTLRIDKSRPTIDIKVSDIKTDRATLTLTCNDPETGITKYEYSKDNGGSWVTGSNSYTYTGLSQTTSYKYKGRCTNGVGLSNEESVSSSTTEVKAPTIVQISQTPSGTWATSRTIRITYYNTNVVGARYYYSYDGSNWKEVTGTTDLTFTNNSLLYAKTTDATGNYKQASTYTITNIETSNPSTPSITYNGGSNTCSWKNNYNLTLSSSASSGIAYYEIDVDNNGTADHTTGSNFIPWDGYSTCYARFRSVSNTGRRSSWTEFQHIHMDTTSPSTPSITYNGGSNTCSWKNNYNLTLSSSDNIGVSYYQIDTNGDGTPDSNISSNWIPSNGFNSHNVKFRAVDYAGNVSGWTSGQHIHMDTEIPSTPSITGGSDNWTNSTRTISISGQSSAISGVARYEYYISNSPTTQSGGSWITGSSVNVSNEGIWYVYFRAISNASNVSGISSYQVAKIDKTSPTITFNVKSGACVRVNTYKLSCFSDAQLEVIVSDNTASTLYWGVCNMSTGCKNYYAYDYIENNGSKDMDSSQNLIKTGLINVPLGSQVKLFAIGYDSANNNTLYNYDYFEFANVKYNYINIES